jgi:NAD(P)-dependent dehydrogenase (short-subunit alcohol dehydrogenase family)
VENFTDITRERLERTFRSNIMAMFTLAQHTLPHIPRGGTIINVASVQAYDPSPGIIDYAASKVCGGFVTGTNGTFGPIWKCRIEQFGS